MPITELLAQKIRTDDFIRIIETYRENFSAAETELLLEILSRFQFDATQAQALAQAVMQQARFDPDALHFESEDDEDTTGVCPHCINPPVPPLRDYQMWRDSKK